MKYKFLWLYALTPLHNGAGQGLGSIDRPIIREAATGYPFVQSSSLKGALRARAIEALMPERKGAAGAIVRQKRTREQVEQDADLLAAFGKGETDGNQGCLIFTDAQLFLLPVRSLAGTFAWVTSQLSLARLFRWLEIAGDVVFKVTENGREARQEGISLFKNLLESLHSKFERGNAIGCKNHDGAIRIDNQGTYCLEGLVLKPDAQYDAAGPKLAQLADWLGLAVFQEDAFWTRFLKEHLLLLADDDYDHLVVHHAMQVEANIQIVETGVTKDGSLRYTEYLQAESVLISLATIMPPLRKGYDGGIEKIETLFNETLNYHAPFQLGADESKGRGVVRVIGSDSQLSGETKGVTP